MTSSRRILSIVCLLPLLAIAASCSNDDGGTAPLRAGGLGDGEIAEEGADSLPGAVAAPAGEAAAPAAADPGASYADEASGYGPSAGAGVPAGGDGDGYESEDGASASGAPAPLPDDDEPAPIDEIPPPAPPQVGTLTAGAWDDNRNLDLFLTYRNDMQQQNLEGLIDFSIDEHQAAHDAHAELAAHTTLDVSLVIDTTGSMGDELSYLQAEFLGISAAIEAKYPNAEQRWSLVLYKDEGQGDEYVTRWFDFRDSAEEFRSHLAEQSVSGGGDFPEAPDAAFEVMNQLAWRTDPATARLAFWVADAPHHADKASALKAGIKAAEAQDIHVYPVASSGIDDLTELTMRSAAQLTGGRYLFLTDDSGIGNVHKEPLVPCYFVTQLDSAILRMVDVEMSGVYREPSAEEIVRTSGDPQDGACTLQSGQPAFAF